MASAPEPAPRVASAFVSHRQSLLALLGRVSGLANLHKSCRGALRSVGIQPGLRTLVSILCVIRSIIQGAEHCHPLLLLDSLSMTRVVSKASRIDSTRFSALPQIDTWNSSKGDKAILAIVACKFCSSAGRLDPLPVD